MPILDQKAQPQHCAVYVRQMAAQYANTGLANIFPVISALYHALSMTTYCYIK